MLKSVSQATNANLMISISMPKEKDIAQVVKYMEAMLGSLLLHQWVHKHLTQKNTSPG